MLMLLLACSVSEYCENIEILYTALSRERIMNALIRLRRCAVWSAPLLFACNKVRFSGIEVQIIRTDGSISS